MSDLRYSSLWRLAGAAIAFIAFGINFWIAHGSLPGYRILAFPGILSAGFFSEEIDFWPKLTIMVAGQHFTYFFVVFTVRKLIKYRQNSRT